RRGAGGRRHAAAPGGRAGQGPHRGRHLGRRLRPPAHQEHRAAAADQGWLGRGAGPGRRSRAALEMLAEARLPRGTSDMQGLSALNMAQMNDAGVVTQIDYTKLKNAANLLPAMKYPYGIGQIYSGKVGVCNPKLIPVQ